LALLLVVLASTAVACNSVDGSEPVAGGGADPTATTSAQTIATATATVIPSPTPMPTPEPARNCVTDPSGYAASLRQLEDDVTRTMDGYDGTWGFAIIDLDCGAMAAINPDYVQYAASAGKLPFIIAALRAVQEGRLDLAEIQEDLELVLHFSLDKSADKIGERVTNDEVWEVLRLADVSELTTFRDAWRNFFTTPADLARIWAALMAGELLDEERTNLLLTLAGEVEVPPAYETWPAEFDEPSLLFGQKAGYWVTAGTPYFLVGAGYLTPADGSSLGFAPVILLIGNNEDLNDPQRRSVFPYVLNFVLDELSALESASD
jgi:Beta-lactamase enzyme family